MGKRYLIVSDLHLCDVEDHADGWKPYKASGCLFDDELIELLGDFARKAQDGERLILVLNGDVFDFDMVTAVPENPPWPVGGRERRRGLDASEEKSAWKLGRILADHPVFVRALADFMGSGHQVVYVLGNHDRELHFAGVRQVLIDAIEKWMPVQGDGLAADAIRFETWFYYEPGEMYVEHGQQYDHYSAFRHLLNPTVRNGDKQMLALPMANLSNRYLMTRMGFFNPYASDYILNAFRYLIHWFRCYAFTRRSLVLNWLWGSLVVIAQLLRTRRRLLRRQRDSLPQLEEVAVRSGLPLQTVKALHALQSPPITSRFFRIVREFWIDRLLLGLFMTGGTVALALAPIPLWIKLMVPLSTFPLLYFIYEWLAQGENIFTIEKKLPKVARSVAQLVDVPLVVFGHTHVPRLLPLQKGATFVDTGTWAPIMRKQEDCKGQLAPGYRNYLHVHITPDGPQLRFASAVPIPASERRSIEECLRN